ncbi:MAG: U32 family peptidase [Bacilli bacterium]|nr:U32 family peptidase [Mollicutes bacterium]MDY3899403.1 U32 family peptidase [Bacilli bacterium]
MKKVELLAPAGNLEKAKIALLYGADAVYVGGKEFSLRARASNFTREDLKDLSEFAHNLNKKMYVTCNIIPHNEDFAGLDDYLKFLSEIGVDAIITSSLGLIQKAKVIAPNVEIHISTQTSITNSKAIKFWQTVGATRVVLAREVSIKEIEKIRKNTSLELEVFIHGGMCASYSGRCTLSNYMTKRDANRGGCAHSCRWNYSLIYGKKQLNLPSEFFNMGSKDLMSIDQIERLIKVGTASLKIEGRMKSPYYIATVVRSYRMVIDEYYNLGFVKKETLEFAKHEIQKAENRLTSCGFLEGMVTPNEQLYEVRNEEPTKEYVGYVLSYDEETKTAVIEQRNYFKLGDTLEFFGPNLPNTLYVVEKMIDATTNEELDVARHPLQQFKMQVPFTVHPHDMVRLIK